MKKVVTVVLNSFKNDSRVLKEAISLHQNGYDVVVVALHEDPLQIRENVRGVVVHRVELKSKSWPKFKPVQLIKYIEFVFRVVKEYKNVPIIHCNDLHTLPVGVLIKRFSGKNTKIVYDAHEYEINDRPNQSKNSIRIRYLLEKYLIKYADKILTVSNSIAEEYVKLYNIEKPALVLNAPPYRDIEKGNVFARKFGITKQQNVFLYQGGLSHGRGIEILIEVFGKASADNVLVFMGFGPLKGVVQEACGKYKNIFYHPAVPPDTLLEFTASADYGILFYKNNCLNHYFCSPNKLFEYLMAGLPVIVSNLYEMKKIVELNRVGVVAEDDTVLGLERAIEKVLKLDLTVLRDNVRKVKGMYNWEEQEKILLDTYRDLDLCAVSAE